MAASTAVSQFCKKLLRLHDLPEARLDLTAGHA